MVSKDSLTKPTEGQLDDILAKPFPKDSLVRMMFTKATSEYSAGNKEGAIALVSTTLSRHPDARKLLADYNKELARDYNQLYPETYSVK